ncbi:protein S100-A6-like [Aquarana catesbeiana]|uniref:protein S100-A6-like n=1 Tax=Aquarana catesbeiana TaxID=8400 RepID=UPI003CC99D37
MTAILKPTNKMFCLLIFLSLFSAYSTEDGYLTFLITMDRKLKMEDILALLVMKFQSFASKSSEDMNTMSTDKMYDMVRAEFPTLRGRAKNNASLERIISTMDDNEDKKVTFKELMRFLGSLATMFIKDAIE